MVIALVACNLIAFNASYYVARLADQGLAHAVALATLRHGTGFTGWLGIHTLGPMPSMGELLPPRSWGGSEMDCRNRFYCANDSDFFQTSYSRPDPIGNRVMMRVLPKIYCFRASWIPGLLIPSIKLRISPEQWKKYFTRDERIESGQASYTENWWSPLNLGLVGTLYNSLTYKTPIRMLQDPKRVITGIAMVALAAGAAAAALSLAPELLITYKVAIIAGAALAAI